MIDNLKPARPTVYLMEDYDETQGFQQTALRVQHVNFPGTPHFNDPLVANLQDDEYDKKGTFRLLEFYHDILCDKKLINVLETLTRRIKEMSRSELPAHYFDVGHVKVHEHFAEDFQRIEEYGTYGCYFDCIIEMIDRFIEHSSVSSNVLETSSAKNPSLSSCRLPGRLSIFSEMAKLGLVLDKRDSLDYEDGTVTDPVALVKRVVKMVDDSIVVSIDFSRIDCSEFRGSVERLFVTKGVPDNPSTFVIAHLRRRGTKITHFVLLDSRGRVCYDPLGISNTVRDNEVIGLRVFDLIIHEKELVWSV